MSSIVPVDPVACTRCGACVDECPTRALAESPSGPPVLTPDVCIDCGHCCAVCVPGAIRSSLGDAPEWPDPRWDPSDAKAFLTGRRSSRHYRARALDRATILEVISVGPYAPTASNAQDVDATVFTGPEVKRLGTLVNGFYGSLDRLLSRKVLRPILWFTSARAYLRSPKRLAVLRDRVRQFQAGHDWLFFDAPAVVVLSAPARNVLFGRVNCVIAAERMMQYAAALELGSCMIGYAEVALRRRPSLARGAGIAPDRVPQVVFTLGIPVTRFTRLPPRRPVPVTWRTGDDATMLTAMPPVDRSRGRSVDASGVLPVTGHPE